MRLRRGLVLVFAVMLIAGCGSKYSDVIDVNTKFVIAMENYVAGLENAGSAQEAAAAINDFAAEMEKLGPKMKAVNEKYPELENSKEVPEELKALEKRVKNMQIQMGAAMMNVMRYMMDPDVQEAQKRLNAAMMQMS